MSRARAFAAVALTTLATNVRLLVAAAGLVLAAYGLALAWLPLAFIVPGGVMVALGVGGATVDALARARAVAAAAGEVRE